MEESIFPNLKVKFHEKQAQTVLLWLQQKLNQRSSKAEVDIHQFVAQTKQTIAKTHEITVEEIPIGIQLYLVNTLAKSEVAFEEMKDYIETECLIDKLCTVRAVLEQKKRLKQARQQCKLQDWLVQED